MADRDVKVIFHRRYSVLTILLVVAMAVIGIFIVWDADDRQAGIFVALICVPLVLAICAVAAHIAGRRQLSWIAEDGPDLLVRRVHFLDRGKILRIPKQEITDWQVETRTYKRGTYSDISFRHGGRVFALYLSDDAHPDMEAFEALIPGNISSRKL